MKDLKAEFEQIYSLSIRRGEDSATVWEWLTETYSKQLHKPDVVRSLPSAEEILQATDKLVESSRLTGKRHKEAIRFGFANGVDWMKKRSGQ